MPEKVMAVLLTPAYVVTCAVTLAVYGAMHAWPHMWRGQ